MIYYVSVSARRGGNGSKDKPFKTINAAARIARPGDEIIVAPGIYRENVNPINGGTEENRIVYRSEIPGKAVITGAEPAKKWTHYDGNTWQLVVPNGFFDEYNPYVVKVFGDWFYADSVHTGEVYLNGKSMYEKATLEEVLSPEPYTLSWKPKESLYTWYTEQTEKDTVIYANFQGADPNENNVEINVRRNCFWPQETGVNYITVSGFTMKQAATTWAPPTAFQDGLIGPNWSKGWIIEDCEILDSKCVGISLGKYLQPENENKWTLQRFKQGTQTERDAICQAQYEGWNKENIGSHTIRRCHIHHCEQAGIAGHLGCIFSVIEDNHIHDINTKQQLVGAEIAGIKLHAAIDTLLCRNHIHHCTRGIWLDWQAQGTRVTQSLFHDNLTPEGVDVPTPGAIGQDLYIEVSHGPTLVDNNIFLTSLAAKISTQGVAYVHNLICGSFTDVGSGTDNGGGQIKSSGAGARYTPYHVPHRTEIAGFMTFLHGDDRFYNNIFVQNPDNPVPKTIQNFLEERDIEKNPIVGTIPFEDFPTEEEWRPMFFIEGDSGCKENRVKYYSRLPVTTSGNVFFNGAKKCSKEKNYREVDDPVYVKLEEENGQYYLVTNLYEYLPEFATEFVCSDILGKAFEPEQRFENPDGSSILFDRDYYDEKRGMNPVPGPFEMPESEKIPV